MRTTHALLRLARTASSSLLLLALASACGSNSASPLSTPSAAGSRRVRVQAGQAKDLKEHGAKPVMDYGAFQLMEVEDHVLAQVEEEMGLALEPVEQDILLNAGKVDTKAPAGGRVIKLDRPKHAMAMHLVQFVGPIKAEWLAALTATGVELVTYIPNNAYLIKGDAQAFERLETHLRSASAIQWDGPYLDDYKVQPDALDNATPDYAVQLVEDDRTNAASLAVLEGIHGQTLRVDRALGYLNINITLAKGGLAVVAALPDVVSIHVRPVMKLLDERANMVVAGAMAANGSPTGPGYLAWLASRGFTAAQFAASGFGVDVTDSGLDNGTTAPNHLGLYPNADTANTSRVAYARLEGTPSSGSTVQGCDGHGNLNGHIIGGFGNQTAAPFTDAQGYLYGLGVAPYVKLGSSVVFDPGNFTNPVYEDLQSRAFRDGMRISSNSWGSNTNTYGSESQRYDALVRDAQPAGAAVPNPGNQEMVVVFAAGNSGPGANTVGTPGTAKNIITVGASESPRAIGGSDNCAVGDGEADSALDMANFSSRGPASDGRKKPDLTAPGTHVTGGVAQAAEQRSPATRNANGKALTCFDGSGVCGGVGINFMPAGQEWFTASSGTSHSTPMVSGGAALVRQFFINKGLPPPSPAMTKAVLLNTARYMTGAGANDSRYSNNQGMGFMNLGAALDDTPNLLDDQVPANLFTATGQARTFAGVVASDSKPFLVTLAWTDAPGSTTGSAWKNNLDLSVTVGGNTYKGNVFTGANSVTGGTADVSNNVESVFLPAGATGAYTVTVTAANINSDGVPGNASALDQDFALVAYNSCNTAPAAVTGVAVATDGDNALKVSWQDNGADAYVVYHSITPGGPYTRVGEATASPFTETGVSGGTRYYYVVRARLCAESPSSAEVNALATGLCTLPPTFAGAAAATSAGAATCGANVSWAAATPVCGGTVNYNVYRSTTAGFVPSRANRIATGVSGTSFADTLNLANGGTYTYVVRAVETSNATVEDTNLVKRTAQAFGALVPGLRYFDNLDGTRPPNAAAYWLPTNISGTAGTINLLNGCHYQSATNAYRFGAANTACGGTYPVSVQAQLTLGGNGSTAGINGFAIPASANAPSMSFNVWYDFESQYDGAYLTYSTTGATGTFVPVSDVVSATAPFISAGGYDNTLKSNTGIRIWTSANTGANGALKAVSVNLDALKGQTVWFGFRFYTDLSQNREGFYVDDVRITADSFNACTTSTPPAGPAVAYTLNNLATTAQAGVPTTFDVQAVDALGLNAASYAGTAAVTSSDTQAVLPGNQTFVAGKALAIPVDMRSMGAQTITITDTIDAQLTASGSITVTPGPASQLRFRNQPATAVAGTSLGNVQVELLDQFGNPTGAGTQTITLAMGLNPTGAPLLGPALAVDAVAGVATFPGLHLEKVGTGYTLMATADMLTGMESTAFDITPAAAASLSFTQEATTVAAGQPITPAVAVTTLDAFGNVATAPVAVTLVLSANPGNTLLLGSTTVNTVDGVATFADLHLTMVAAGYALSASSGVLPVVAGAPFDVTPATPFKSLFTVNPSDVVAGAVMAPSVEVTLYDRYDNVATQGTNQVSLFLGNNSTGAHLGGTLAKPSINGVATFDDLTLDKVGAAYTLMAGSSGLRTDQSPAFDVLPGAPAALMFQTQPGTTSAGAALADLKVALLDASGNTLTGTTANVMLMLSSGPAGGVVAGTVAADTVNGVATFSGLSINLAGAGYQFTASSTGVADAMSNTFAITPSDAVALTWVTNPAMQVMAGAELTPPLEIALLDAQGNTATGAQGTVTLALAQNPGNATLGGQATALVVNGVATFTGLSLDRPGMGYVFSASSGAFMAMDSTAFEVVPGTPASLVFAAQPVDGTAGVTMASLAVELRDVAGNLVPQDGLAITLSLSGNAAAHLGGTVSQPTVAGVAKFVDLSVDVAGTGYVLTAQGGTLSVASQAFAMTAGEATQLVFEVEPSDVVAGGSIIPAVRVAARDAQGNLQPAFTSAITVALEGGTAGATLLGTTSVNAVMGKASFPDLAVGVRGAGYTIRASSGTLAQALSASFSVAEGPAARMAFVSMPAGAVAGEALAPVVVEVRDALGNTLPSATTSITLVLGGAQGTLEGVATADAVAGVATFNGLSIAHAANGYTLTARSLSLADVVTPAFNVVPGPAVRFVVEMHPSVTVAQPVVVAATAMDAQDNVATGYAGTAAFQVTDPLAVFPQPTAFSAGLLPASMVTFRTLGLITLDVVDQAHPEVRGSAQTNVTPFAQPTVAILDPADGAVLSGTVTLRAKGQVALGTSLAKLRLLVDGIVLGTSTTDTLEVAWNTAALTPGSAHTITALVQDAAGNVANALPVGVTIAGSPDAGMGTSSSGSSASSGDGSAPAQPSCGCDAASRTEPTLALALAGLVLLVRRRRPKG